MFDVAIVGAGLAGLRCAEVLVASGASVVVLEARDRVGGRVFSHHFGDGQTCERGAEFIDSNHAEVLALADRLGAEADRTLSRPRPGGHTARRRRPCGADVDARLDCT